MVSSLLVAWLSHPVVEILAHGGLPEPSDFLLHFSSASCFLVLFSCLMVRNSRTSSADPTCGQPTPASLILSLILWVRSLISRSKGRTK